MSVAVSVVVVVYNMSREAPRTLYSLSTKYQRRIGADEYEVIVVDNGSDPAFDPCIFDSLDGNFRLIRMDPAPPSPARAINRGLREARGELIGVMIDGARIVTPGLLHFARSASLLYPRAIVATLGWYLGYDIQRRSIEAGYDQIQEDALLRSIGWPHDGYRLFEIATLDESSTDGWFSRFNESNALFLKREFWQAMHGVDEVFDAPGGGLLNLDTLCRAMELPGSELVLLLGEATFHQLHGGIATNASPEQLTQRLGAWLGQYAEVRGRPFAIPWKTPTYLGTLPRSALLRMVGTITHPLKPGSPLGPHFDRNLCALEPAKRPVDSIAAELVDIAHEELRAGRYAATAAVARLTRQYFPDEPEPQRLLTLVGPALVERLPEVPTAAFHAALGLAYAKLGDDERSRAEFDYSSALDAGYLPTGIEFAIPDASEHPVGSPSLRVPAITHTGGEPRAEDRFDAEDSRRSIPAYPRMQESPPSEARTNGLVPIALPRRADASVTSDSHAEGLAQAALFGVPDGMLLAGESGEVWVVYGGAKFHVPNPETLSRLFADLPCRRVSGGALDAIGVTPADGTLLCEEIGRIWIIYGGAKFHVPNPETLSRLFADVPCCRVWDGALDAIGVIPANDTLLCEESGAAWIIYGGAKFHVPNLETLSRLYGDLPRCRIWNGALDAIGRTPADGTLLCEENGASWVIYSSARSRMPDLPTLSCLFADVPRHRIWDGALSCIPEWEVIAAEFDTPFYLSSNPDVVSSRVDPLKHYLDHGWHEHRDPTPWFSTQFYLDHQPDVRLSGINPFYHYIQSGRAEGRKPCRAPSLTKKPIVSVIVPNYNHAQFLTERLDSILEQSYNNIEILVLDDASTDGSREIIETFQSRHPAKIRTYFNNENSGSVFHQWRQGLNQVHGELVWICESDDSCQRDFLEVLVPHFADPSIMLAFGRTQLIDAQGMERQWLDSYRESAGPGIWSDVRIAPAFEWFRGPFAIRNVIPNVGGCIFRRQPLPDAVWDEAMKYRVLGDWFLYSQLCGGGRIAYNPKAVSFFRQHSGNTSGRGFTRDFFWHEHLWLAKTLRQRFGTPKEVLFRFTEVLSDLYAEVFGENCRKDMWQLFNLAELLRVEHTQKHILIAFYGFHTGGGEVFAIHLANHLVELGYIISMLCVVDHSVIDNEAIRGMLDPRIATYERQLVDEMGVEPFLRATGIDIVHSHFLEAEFLFFANNEGRLGIPYVVTLHGSYEALRQMGRSIDDSQLMAFLRGVDYWVYLADNNLYYLKDIPIAKERVLRFPNALKVENAAFPYSRHDLGADADSVIFGIASRAIRDKGWAESIQALHLAQSKTDRRLMLLLCGDGPELTRLQPMHRADPAVRFFGFQENIHGLFRLCDCCLLPTQFIGESFPLTLVQSFQVGTPAIATDIGSIPSMMEADGRSAGILVRLDSETFVMELACAMIKMTENAFRSARAEDASIIGRRYDLDLLAREYLSLYAKAGHW